MGVSPPAAVRAGRPGLRDVEPRAREAPVAAASDGHGRRDAGREEKEVGDRQDEYVQEGVKKVRMGTFSSNVGLGVETINTYSPFYKRQHKVNIPAHRPEGISSRKNETMSYFKTVLLHRAYTVGHSLTSCG